MRTITKRLSAFILCLILLCGTVPMTASASTNGKTAAQATDWARQQVNSPTDFDGVNDIQCVDLIVGYYRYLGQSSPYGDGCAYASNALPSGWNRITYYSGFVPNPGDVAVWTYASSAKGHVAIVLSTDKSGFTVAQFNGSSHTGSTQYYSYSYGTLACFIRPDFNGSSVPSNLWVSLPNGPESSYKINSQVNISFGANNAVKFCLQIYKEKDKYWYGEFNSTSGSAVCPASFDKTGHYSCYIKAISSSGQFSTSGWIGWDIVDKVPSNPRILINRSNLSVYSVGEEITFSLTADYGYYKHIGIHRVSDDKLIKENDVAGESFKCTINDVGTYYADFHAFNACGYSASNKVYFQVVSKKPTKSVVQIINSSESNYTVGSTINFKFLTEGANKISWGIHKVENSTDKLVEWKYTEKNTLSYKFDEEGYYHISIDAINNYGELRSEKVYFKIVHNTHSYTSKVTKAATCTANGVRTYTCSCGDSYTESIAALGHSYKSVVTPPTCTAQGYTTFTCTRSGCGHSYKSNYTNAKGHTPGEWKITKEPTTTSTGSKTLYCSDCGQAVKTETIPKLVQPQGKVHSVAINDLELNYKQTGSLNPVIKADSGTSYTVSYTSSNSDIASVDNNGNVYAAKRGSAKITVTVTDSYGNSVTDDCIVNVDYSGLQWFIIIVLFGWIWYI